MFEFQLLKAKNIHKYTYKILHHVALNPIILTSEEVVKTSYCCLELWEQTQDSQDSKSQTTG